MMSPRLVTAFGKSFTRNILLFQRICARNVLVTSTSSFHGRKQIGEREVVGYGTNGSYIYFDRPDFPMPAIRFREDDAALSSLRAKEKGNWKQLTLEEKKALYRASYCSTFAEITAPTGEWKSILAGVMAFTAFAFLVFGLMRQFVYPPMPESMSLESKKKQMRDYIILEIDPIDGISSKWDYEKNRWKD